MKTKLVLVILILSAAIGGYFLFGPDRDHSKDLVGDSNLTEEELLLYTADLLGALHSYHIASDRNAESAEDFIDLAQIVINIQNDLERGDQLITQYINHEDERIREITDIVLQASQFINWTYSVIDDGLKNLDMNDPSTYSFMSDYEIAEMTVNRKDAWILLGASAAQISTLYFGDPPDPLVGKINYTTSDKLRDKVLAEIDRLFGDSIANEIDDVRGRNVILMTIESIQENLKYERYEDLE